jgi:glutamate racemase
VLGIIDWGIGGVSIYKAIKEKLGPVPIIYFSDTGVTPYGKMTRPELVARLNVVIRFLKSKGVTHLAVGCNAASTAIDLIEPNGMKIEGMIASGVAAAMKKKPTRLGLIGGRRTVLSGIYRDSFAGRGFKVEQRIAQPLSGLIESGDTGSQKLRLEAKQILTPLKNCSHILLACTHYPAVSNLLMEFVPERTVLIDPASELVTRIARWKIPIDGKDLFLTSGDPGAMRAAAKNAFGVTLSSVQRVSGL